MNKVIILGCGPSAGVPLLGHKEGPFWGDCNPQQLKNNRSRASVYVEYQGIKFLIDTSPDMRRQLLDNHIYSIDCVLMSHFHADHCHGIDELRPIVFMRGRQPMPLYADQFTLSELQLRFSYLFQQTDPNYFKIIEAHVVMESIQFQDTIIIPIEQKHGSYTSLGYRFDKFAYSPDFNDLSEESIEKLQGLDLWVVDCLSRKANSTHNHLDLTLYWIDRVKPKQAVLTHMTYDLDHDTLCRELPPHIRPAHDGMVLPF